MNIRLRNNGFTLIELLIALTIMGILAALALPSYHAYVLRSHRAEGISTLNNIQLQQEKYKTYHTLYGTLAQVWTGALTENGYYALTVTNPSATGYVLTATGQGDQANDAQNGTACGTLTLTVNGLNTILAPAVCWAH